MRQAKSIRSNAIVAALEELATVIHGLLRYKQNLKFKKNFLDELQEIYRYFVSLSSFCEIYQL